MKSCGRKSIECVWDVMETLELEWGTEEERLRTRQRIKDNDEIWCKALEAMLKEENE